jgi:hypothetical protein
MIEGAGCKDIYSTPAGKLALPLLIQQLSEYLLAIETRAPIELVDAHGNGIPQRRELLLLLLVEAVRIFHEVAPIAERSIKPAFSTIAKHAVEPA